ncbi:hypothetical protein ABTN71_19510, partial [Acinetobacter baumannii]
MDSIDVVYGIGDELRRFRDAPHGFTGGRQAINPGMVRVLALILAPFLAMAAVAPAAWARQPLFSLTVASPNSDSTAYSVAIAPL